MIKLLIIEDHPLVVEGFKNLIDSRDDFSLCGIAGNAEDALLLLKSCLPDIVLLDIMLPGMTGLELIDILQKDYPKSKVLVVSTYSQRYYVEAMLEKGAKGYLLKNAGNDEIIEAITSVYYDQTYLSHEIAFSLRKNAGQPISLSHREIEVLKLVADGLTNKEIAEKLFISPLTVDSHRKNMIAKLEARNTASLIKIAVENGYFSLRNDTNELK
ncbi:MAG: response regulator transcription factor [Lentimicrobiaceae bacterium]|jgi:DNA-binding NarL/FixJ family response regulator|nr:response regulator transcription factor [Lentimicrobiaceae bacterium]MDD4596909.1 response regulator transcription factor [Lentimicrobiaceae bacterium]MDY0025775.1 response regulator transcription factor [Lentimicrobium sp.]HAH57563.1 DNA-binding response regulator [Bacteroidales bacterium]